MSRRREHTLTIETEGQRLLLARPETTARLAKTVGVPAQRIDEWKSGRVVPSGKSARTLLDRIGIPLDAWSRIPGPTSPAFAAPVEEARTLTSLAEIDEMLAALRVGGAGLVEKERAKRSAERIQLLRLKSQIEHRAALAEDAIVRAHPHWKRIRDAIRTALAKYPEALAALAADLGALGEWEAAKDALTDSPDSPDEGEE